MNLIACMYDGKLMLGQWFYYINKVTDHQHDSLMDQMCPVLLHSTVRYAIEICFC